MALSFGHTYSPHRRFVLTERRLPPHRCPSIVVPRRVGDPVGKRIGGEVALNLDPFKSCQCQRVRQGGSTPAMGGISQPRTLAMLWIKVAVSSHFVQTRFPISTHRSSNLCTCIFVLPICTA